MEKISQKDLRKLIDGFLKWFNNDGEDHRSRKGEYSKFQSKAFWEELDDNSFKELMFKFCWEGGKIQGGGHRTANRFIVTNSSRLNELKSLIISCFKDNFDWKLWWDEVSTFKFFGQGIRSIMLHKLNPALYPILNDKSKRCLKALNYLVKPSSYSKVLYEQILVNMSEFIKDCNSITKEHFKFDFYSADAMMHYLDGTKEGRILFEEVKKSNEVTSSDNQPNSENDKSTQIPINTNIILYGPPGTGKTYNTIEYVKNEILDDIAMQRMDVLNSNTVYFVTFHQSYSYEQFIEGISVNTKDGNTVYEIQDGIFKKACKKAYELAKFAPIFSDDKKWTKESVGNIDDRNKLFNENFQPVVIIIDEINRGNISKIFGELITLIEDDKRLGEDNELIVTLPYSSEQFGVPPNLYIIGTMNTADRSLVQLDTALRRRFEFEEMMPKYRKDLNEWVAYSEYDKYDLSLFLENLNAKISKEYDRDHQVGHSFLMKVKDIPQLQRAWENKIMPLLQEYFYSDYEKLSKVIGDKSEYLKRDGEDWELNMRVKDFDSQFKLVYDSVCPEVKTTNNQEDNHLPTVS